MTIDEAMREIGRLRRDNEVLRSEFSLHPPTCIPQAGGWWILLDAYEIANLTSALDAVGRGGSPLGILHSGDWTMQVFHKLKSVGVLSQPPNVTPEGYIERANMQTQP